MPAPGATGPTVAVKTTVSPETEALSGEEETTATEVPALLTVWPPESVAVEVVKLGPEL